MESRLEAAALLCHLDVMQRVARELCGEQDAEDLVQEACVRVLSRPRVVEAGQQAAYLCTTVRNTYLDRHRRARSQPVEDGPPDFRASDLRATPGIRRLAVRESLDGLPDAQRATVLAVDVLGMPYAEAARAMGVPAGTVMSRLHRARRTLAAELDALAA